MVEPSFRKLLARIENDENFQSGNGRKKQCPVWIQLLVVLTRLGCFGNGASVGRIGFTCGFGVGTVDIFTKRVFKAILKLKREFIYWPDAAEREQLSARMERKHGLGGAVLSTDGTYGVLSQKPGLQGESYWTRKCNYAFNLQLFTDDNKLVRHYNLGWPGSVFDNKIFERTKICMERERYFSDGQYLLADAGYALKDFVLTPYRQPAASLPHNRIFNEVHSSARVAVEHVNGMLKGRFQSLKSIRNPVRNEKEKRQAMDHIVVCLILHNFLITCNDDWEEELEEEEPEDPLEIAARRDCPSAQHFRLKVQEHVLRKHLMI
jgi:hypothetical protein